MYLEPTWQETLLTNPASSGTFTHRWKKSTESQKTAGGCADTLNANNTKGHGVAKCFLDGSPVPLHFIRMSLDSVELVLEVEKEFDIVISDEDASKIITVGNFRDLIIRSLQEKGMNPNEGEVMQKLRAIVVEQIGAPPDQVTPEAEFVRDLGLD